MVAAMNPEQIKKWLKKTGNDRAWLARECGVAKKMLDGWLSAGREIPGSSRRIIDSLMSATPRLNPEFSLDEYGQLAKAAEAQGISVNQLVANVVRASILLALLYFYLA